MEIMEKKIETIMMCYIGFRGFSHLASYSASFRPSKAWDTFASA